MKTLYLLRHAKAAQEGPEGDASRPLAARGREAAAAMGSYLARLKPMPELVLCSPSVRTRETLEEVLPALHRPPEILFEERLYLAEPRELLGRIKRLPETVGSVLLVGHNPGIHTLAVLLAPEDARFGDGFPTGALAVLRIAAAWSALAAHESKLVDFRTPKSLKSDPAAERD